MCLKIGLEYAVRIQDFLKINIFSWRRKIINSNQIIKKHSIPDETIQYSPNLNLNIRIKDGISLDVFSCLTDTKPFPSSFCRYILSSFSFT